MTDRDSWAGASGHAGHVGEAYYPPIAALPSDQRSPTTTMNTTPTTDQHRHDQYRDRTTGGAH